MRRAASPKSIELSQMNGLLSFDYDSLQGQRVVSIMGCAARQTKEGMKVNQVALILERATLLISVHEDTDEIILRASEDGRAIMGSSRKWRKLTPLSKYTAKKVGWCWTARNDRGYGDLFILSFRGIEPEIVFCGIASSLWIYKVKRI